MKNSLHFYRKWGGKMRKTMLLARANLKTSKGQAVSIIALIILASMLLNIWIILGFDYKWNFNRFHDKLHSEHVTVLFDDTSKEAKEAVTNLLENDGRTQEYSMNDVLWFDGSFDYNDGSFSTNYFALEKETALKKEIGCFEITEESAYQNGVYLPMLYQMGNNYQTGDTICIKIGNQNQTYTVCGFFNHMMAGSHNCGTCALLFTEEAYQSLAKLPFVSKATQLSVRIQDKSDSESFEASVKNGIASALPSIRALSNSYETVSMSRFISQMILAGIVSAMAFFITLIALVVISSNTAHQIRENMKNLGALKAIGYTGKQLIASLLFQFLCLSFVAQIAGIALSYAVFPKLNAMMMTQTGIPYEVRFLAMPFLVTVGVISGTVFLAVSLSSRKIQKIEPVTALRQGMKTHNFKRNPIPLSNARMPLPFALALKTTLFEKKQNITVCITMLTLSLMTAFSCVILRNVILDKDPMVELIVGETSDAFVNISLDAKTDFLQAMEQDPRVEKTYLYHDIEVRHFGHLALTATVTEDCKALNNQNLCIKGRFPKYENEMLIGAKYAQEEHLKIGDSITLTADGKKADFIISGLTQSSNYLGKDCMLLRSGYERMGKFPSECYYVNVAKGTDIDALLEDIKKQFSNRINYSGNAQEILDSTTSVYTAIMKVIVAACLLLCLTVIAFVLFLLIRAMLTHKKQEYGILKALGFTTGQLVLQTAASFLPALILSAIIGLSISAVIINPLIALFLKGIGMIKCTFEMPAALLTVSGICIVSAAFLFACLMSFKIRKITPMGMLTEE